jgi:arylsulfatase A-like enzyme
VLELLGLRAARAAARPVFYEKVERSDVANAVQHKAVRIGRWKFIRRYAHTAQQELRIVGEELYDLERDPREETNLFGAPPSEAPLRRLEAELLRFSAADVRFADLAARLAAERAALDPESRRILEALGY